MDKKIVIVINGKPRAGKDTTVKLMRAQFEVRGWATNEFSSIDPVRAMFDALNITPEEKTPAYRDALAEVGFALEKFCKLRSNACKLRIINFMREEHGPGHVFFLHMREPMLIEQMREWAKSENYGFHTVLVTGRGEDVWSNDADALVGRTNVDTYITNSTSLESLSNMVAQFCQRLAS